jgi:hypothetical protein
MSFDRCAESLDSQRHCLPTCSVLLSPSRSVGHRGKFGHEFMEFELMPDGRLRYANNSQYKNDVMIRKEGAGWRRGCLSRSRVYARSIRETARDARSLRYLSSIR